MQSSLARTAFVALVLCGLSTGPATAQKRLALLVGNQNYTTAVGALKNPHNDVVLMGEALKEIGFETLAPLKDAKRSAMLGAVRQFANALNAGGPNSIGFFYYAGHGAAEPNGVNYLIPMDATEPDSAEFWDQSVKLDDILSILKTASKASYFVVFDACRNELNLPLRSTNRGFIPIGEQTGMFVAYSSAPGQPASDKGAKSGPYAAVLASELVRPGQSHLDLFQNVKENVATATGGRQEPWELNGLRRRIYFAGEVAPKKIVMSEQPRLALLIGNGRYVGEAAVLVNPANDVRLVAGVLEKLKFKVTVLVDGELEQMKNAIAKHVAEVKAAGKDAVSFVYYAGHGATDATTNIEYMVPVDAMSTKGVNFWHRSIKLPEVVDQLSISAPDALHYVVYDTSRDKVRMTPAANAQPVPSGEKAPQTDKDQDSLVVPKQTGVLLAYSTARGQVAMDGSDSDKSGPYAKILSEEIVKPGYEALPMFRRVQLRVKAFRGQEPELVVPVLPEFFFGGEEVPVDRAVSAPAPKN